MTTKRNILITGATGTIGEATVSELMKHPDINLILVGRNSTLLNQLKGDLLKINSKNTVDLIVADLSELKAATHTIEAITQKYSNLFALVNLVATIKKQKTYTSEKIETMFATNYLSLFHLATKLSNFYSEPLKVVFVSGATTSKIDFDNLQSEKKYSSILNFGQSKTCGILFIKKLSRQFASSKSIAVGFDPGVVKQKSKAGDETPVIFKILGKLIGKSSEKSAKSLAELVMNNDFTNGNFYNKNLEKIKLSDYSEEIALQDKLYDLTNELIKNRTKA